MEPANNISYKNILLSDDEQNDAGFGGNDGWAREPLIKYCNLPDDACCRLSAVPNGKYCITVFDGETPIGHHNANESISHFAHDWKNIPDVRNDYQDNEIVVGLCNLLEDVTNNEYLLTQQLEKYKKFAHKCGLMVMRNYEKRGIGSKLIEVCDGVLKENGVEVASVGTMNNCATSIYRKNGYNEYKLFNYRDYGLDLDGGYTIMYKIL